MTCAWTKKSHLGAVHSAITAISVVGP